MSVEDCIRSNTMSFQNAFVIWKVVFLAFSLTSKCLVWKVGDRNEVRLGDEPWVGCDENYKLPRNMVGALRE
jgi:hypothetical protein